MLHLGMRKLPIRGPRAGSPRLQRRGGSGSRIQRLADFLSESSGSKRLLQKRRALLDALLEDDILRVPGHEQHFQAGPEFEGSLGEFASTDFRHHHIGHKQIDGALRIILR